MQTYVDTFAFFWKKVSFFPSKYIEGLIIGDSMENLGEYSAQQRQNWANNQNIIIYENETQLRDFIKLALNNKTFNGKMYFGTISENLAQKIKNDIGMAIEGYNVAIYAQEIRKIIKRHGNEVIESMQGQRAITEADIINIPLIIQNPDKIALDCRLYESKPVIKFVKMINGKITIISWVSKKHKDLAVQTMYSEIKKDGTLATTTAE